MINHIRQLGLLGQSIWVDFISREMLRSGQLRALVEEGVVGVTSNPTIFQKSVSSGNAYDEQIQRLSRGKAGTLDIYEALAIDDIASGADELRAVYNETHGRDGFISIEVNPALAHDTNGTIAEARRLHQKLGRPNVMIKVPGTAAGLPAVTTLIGEGINVNVTLIFSVAMYERVMQAYADGLNRLMSRGKPAGSVSSVASFFVSRVDTLVDRLLSERIAEGDEDLEVLKGHAAVANAKIAYARYKAFFEGQGFAALRDAGARVQRPLWASTGTKNPEYSDTMYVDPLIGANTVNTVPLPTLEAIRDHANVGQTIEQGLDQAYATMERLRVAGIEMEAVTGQLLTDGVKLFADSFGKLLGDIEAKRRVAA